MKSNKELKINKQKKIDTILLKPLHLQSSKLIQHMKHIYLANLQFPALIASQKDQKSLLVWFLGS